jgi:hypothetical protein
MPNYDTNTKILIGQFLKVRKSGNRKIVAIYDFSGRRISFTEFSMLTHTTINLSAQEKGIYLVRIISKDNSETLKIIRQ